MHAPSHEVLPNILQRQISKWTFGSGTDLFFEVHFCGLSLIYTVKYLLTVYRPNPEWEKLWVDQNVDILIWVAIS